MALTVQFGPFRFNTKEDLDALRLAFKARHSALGMVLIGNSTNGQSFQWQVGSEKMTDEELGDQLAAAYCSLGIYDYGQPTGNRSAVSFTSSGGC